MSGGGRTSLEKSLSGAPQVCGSGADGGPSGGGEGLQSQALRSGLLLSFLPRSGRVGPSPQQCVQSRNSIGGSSWSPSALKIIRSAPGALRQGEGKRWLRGEWVRVFFINLISGVSRITLSCRSRSNSKRKAPACSRSASPSLFLGSKRPGPSPGEERAWGSGFQLYLRKLWPAPA